MKQMSIKQIIEENKYWMRSLKRQKGGQNLNLKGKYSRNHTMKGRG